MTRTKLLSRIAPGMAPGAAIAPLFALALALAAAPAAAQQSDTGDGGSDAQAQGEEAPSEDGAYGADSDVPQTADNEPTVLEEAVLQELQAIGIGNLSIEKLSSGQLAGILMTLTATDRQDKEEAVTTIAADPEYQPGEIEPESVRDNERVRAALEEALTRAGWSADVSQLDDEQVAALYTELAREGSLESEERIRDVIE